MGLDLTVCVSLDVEAIGDQMAEDGDEAAQIICQFAEELEDEAEEFVETLREQATEPRTALALKALAGLILKGCEA